MRLKTPNFLLKYRQCAMPVMAILLVAAIGGVSFYLREQQTQTAALNSRLPKYWVQKYFGTTDANDPRIGGDDGDPDGDILTNYQEYLYATDPNQEDTDGDGELDSYEVAFNQNPNGPGELVLTIQAKDYVNDLIKNQPDYQEFSQDSILGEVKKMFDPDRAVVLDLPEDHDIIITKDNSIASIEKYFEETKGLMRADETYTEDISANLVDGSGVNNAAAEDALKQLRAYIDVLKKTPVPEQLLPIHKYKIAAFRAGVRMYELVRDDYKPDSENNDQFYKDFFYQVMAAEQAADLELAAWRETGLKLKDMGGF